jgi:hypothetical protein
MPQSEGADRKRLREPCKAAHTSSVIFMQQVQSKTEGSRMSLDQAEETLFPTLLGTSNLF